MNFKTLSGNEIKISIDVGKYKVKSKENCKSDFQYKIGQILLSFLGGMVLLEEFPVVGEGLHLDFFIPNLKVAVEVDGRQHKEFNSFFYKDKYTFEKMKKNDRVKNNWCTLNDIRMVRIESVPTVDELKEMVFYE